jgi:chitodextrinase
MRKVWTLFMILGLSVLAFCAQASANLIVNGDFEAGDSGFTSDYTPPSASGQGEYAIGTDPHSYNGNWTSFGDHTTGGGNMMIVNGATSGGEKVWESDSPIGVKKNTQYVFSYWLASTYHTNLAAIKCKINGVNVGKESAPATPGEWKQVSYVWNSGNEKTATIRLVDTVKEAGGNDFAIDDIVFSAVPIAVIWGPEKGKVGCPVPFLACGSYDPDGSIVKYKWIWDDGTTSTGIWAYHTWTTKRTYTVTLKVTDNDGLTAITTIDVKIKK